MDDGNTTTATGILKGDNSLLTKGLPQVSPVTLSTADSNTTNNKNNGSSSKSQKERLQASTSTKAASASKPSLKATDTTGWSSTDDDDDDDDSGGVIYPGGDGKLSPPVFEKNNPVQPWHPLGPSPGSPAAAHSLSAGARSGGGNGGVAVPAVKLLMSDDENDDDDNEKEGKGKKERSGTARKRSSSIENNMDGSGRDDLWRTRAFKSSAGVLVAGRRGVSGVVTRSRSLSPGEPLRVWCVAVLCFGSMRAAY